MTLMIELTPELEAQVREEAAKAGMDANAFILNTLQDRLRRKATRAAKQSARLSKEEADLILKINERLPEATRQEYYALVAKRRAENLTPEEYTRLVALTDTVEIKNAERIEHLVKLAQLRQVSLEDVMKQLGIRPPGYIMRLCDWL